MAKSLSYEEILARRERRRLKEEREAHKRTPVPYTENLAWTILILQWVQDELWEQWREIELAKAQERKVVLPPGRGPKSGGRRGRGGRRNKVFEALGLD